MRKALLAALLALALGAGAEHRWTTPARGADNTSALAEIEKQTEAIRGLTHKSTVKAAFENDKQFNAEITGSSHRDTPSPEVVLGQRESLLLGWISPRDNYAKILFNGITKQVIGFYDPPSGELYVRSNNGEAFGIRRDVIAHEYTHALQDQYYHLRAIQPDQYKLKYRNSDMVEARHALTEGDAVVTQILFVNQHYSHAEMAKWVKLQQQAPLGKGVPKAIERLFTFPYDTGVTFTIGLYRSGRFKAIDAAYQRLPNSTYEIMHPDAYAKGWKPTSVSLHGVIGMAGWKQMDDDVMGALGYHVMLWEYLPKATATRVVDGYRGDRYIFLEKGKQNAARFESEWDSAASAERARNQFVFALTKRYPGAKVSGSSPEVVTGKGQSIAFNLKGTHLTMTYAPTAALAVQLLRAKIT